jgi:hypothetical protein
MSSIFDFQIRFQIFRRNEKHSRLREGISGNLEIWKRGVMRSVCVYAKNFQNLEIDPQKRGKIAKNSVKKPCKTEFTHI